MRVCRERAEGEREREREYAERERERGREGESSRFVQQKSYYWSKYCLKR